MMYKRDGLAPVERALRVVDGAIAGLMQSTVAVPPNLISEVDRFRMVRGKTLAMLGEVNDEQALWSPRPGVWSIAQIADHLLRSDELYLEQFERLIQMAREGKQSPIRIGFREIDTSLAGIPRDVMKFFEVPVRALGQLMPHALRETIIRHPILPALNPGASEPRPGLAREKLRADLSASLIAMENLLRTPMPRNIDGPTIDHPLLGSNNLLRLFRILIAHEQRHQGQIARLVSVGSYDRA